MGFEKHQPLESQKQGGGHDHLSHARAEIDNHRTGKPNHEHAAEHKATKQSNANHDGALHMSDPFAKSESAAAKNHAGFPRSDAKPQPPQKNPSDAPPQAQNPSSTEVNQDSWKTRNAYTKRHPVAQEFRPESADTIQQPKEIQPSDVPMS